MRNSVKVYGVPRLRVVDASIMPTIVSGLNISIILKKLYTSNKTFENAFSEELF